MASVEQVQGSETTADEVVNTVVEEGARLGVKRFFTIPGRDPFDEIEWETRDAIIPGRDGPAFEQRGVEFPKFWSQTATNIVAQKYFRGRLSSPEREASVKQMVGRVVDTVVAWGKEGGYFADTDEAESFEAELKAILVNQYASFNSPVWFNVGFEATPQCSACFILSIDDSMESILDWIRREGVIFRGGSGSGVNLSRLRSSKEQLSKGGYASGPVSFMRGADASASTIKSWHTLPNTSRINASNPCSEYMSIDDSACNLASLNLMKFRREDGELDVDAFEHAVDVVFLAQEILVGYSSYPTPEIGRNAKRFRQLGLGYANLGALLMARGFPYDSDEGRAYAAAITGLMTGRAYRKSAEIAARMGPFGGYQPNAGAMIGVMSMHRAAVGNIEHADSVPKDLQTACRRAWDEALNLGEVHGYRNAQATVLAPTGTISFMMDCDTTGVEPDFSLVKSKKLVGGGEITIPNKTVPMALEKLGYAPA